MFVETETTILIGKCEMSEDNLPGNSDQTIIEERHKIKVPRLYRVILHNDDYTPMDFVVEILVEIFKKDEITATKIMLDVHNRGKGVCGVYTFEIAETKVSQVRRIAEQYEYPLQASMEEE